MYNLLQGIRVLEVALITPDALGGYLADLGAEVLKIEQPPDGDYVRVLGGGGIAGLSFMHLRWNRGKKSVGLNLKTESGRRVFLDLAKKSHVVVDGLRAGAIERFGIGYETVKQVNPKIVYCSFNATGQSGAYRDLATHGPGFDAYAGHIQPSLRPDGMPYLDFKTLVAMSAGPLYAALGVVSGIVRSLMTGQGAYIEVAQFDAAAAWQANGIDASLNNIEVEPQQLREAVRHQMYRTKDDKYVVFQASEDKFWTSFCRNVGREDLLEGHERKAVASHARGDEPLRQELAAIFATKTRAEWVEFFIEHNVAGSPVNTPEELIHDPHFLSRDLTFEQDHPQAGRVRWFGTPIKVAGQRFSAAPAPSPGEHTQEVLSGVLGLEGSEIEELRSQGAI